MMSIPRRTLDDLLTTFSTQGIDVLDGQPKLPSSALEKKFENEAEASDEVELDLAADALEKTNDPVRIYLREMGVVPLLTREGEVDIAKRIERGQLRALKALSRSPIVIRQILAIGEDLKRGVRSIKEIVVFDEEEITEEILQNRVKDITRRIDELQKHYKRASQLAGRLATIPAKQKAREYSRCRSGLGREIVRISLIIRNLGFTNFERKRLIDRVNKTVDIMRSLDRQVSNLEKKIESTRSEELKKNYRKTQRQHRADLEGLESDAGVRFQELHRTQREIIQGEMDGGAGQARAHRSQPAPRGFHRQEVCQPRASVPRPDPGGQRRPDEGGGQVRVPPRLQVFHLCHVVDSPGNQPSHCRPGAHHPPPGAHDRDRQQADSHLAATGPGAGPRTHVGRDCQADGHSRGQGAQGAQDHAGADLAGDANWRGGGFSPQRPHRRPRRGLARRGGHQREPEGTTAHVLRTLSPREEKIIKMRFGLEDGSEHTLEEVGRSFAVTRERIRQIEAKALRKLRQPSRSRTLKAFLDDVHE